MRTDAGAGGSVRDDRDEVVVTDVSRPARPEPTSAEDRRRPRGDPAPRGRSRAPGGHPRGRDARGRAVPVVAGVGAPARDDARGSRPGGGGQPGVRVRQRVRGRARSWRSAASGPSGRPRTCTAQIDNPGLRRVPFRPALERWVTHAVGGDHHPRQRAGVPRERTRAARAAGHPFDRDGAHLRRQRVVGPARVRRVRHRARMDPGRDRRAEDGRRDHRRGDRTRTPRGRSPRDRGPLPPPGRALAGRDRRAPGRRRHVRQRAGGSAAPGEERRGPDRALGAGVRASGLAAPRARAAAAPPRGPGGSVDRGEVPPAGRLARWTSR